MAKKKYKSVETSVVEFKPLPAPQPPEGFWKGVAKSVTSGLIIAAMSAYFIKPWAEKKIGDLTAKIDGTQNQVIAIQGQVGQLNQNIKNVAQTQSTKAEKAQAVQQGDHNTTTLTQNNTEVKPDFRQDTESSNAVAAKLQEGLNLSAWMDPCGGKISGQQAMDAFGSWYSLTHADLEKISRKAAIAFAATDGKNIDYNLMKNCEKYDRTVFLYQMMVDKYVASLREIIKGL